MSGLSANPERDTAYRDRARVVAIILQRFARGMLVNDDVLLQLRSQGYAQTVLTLPADFMQAIGLPEINVPVLLTKPESSSTLAGFIPPQYPGDPGKILLPVLPFANWRGIYAAWQSEDPQSVAIARLYLETFQVDIDKWFESRKPFVVHEMTHMFDYQRFKNTPQIIDVDRHGIVAYLNSAAELNAFFQEIMAESEEHISELPHVAQAAVASDFDAFWIIVRQTRGYREAWKHYTPKNQRKFYTRAVQFWNSIQPAETEEQRQAPLRLPDVEKQAKVVAEYRREGVRESLFDRLQREIDARRKRRR